MTGRVAVHRSRDRGAVFGRVVHVVVDGRRRGRLVPGGSVVVDLPAGHHVLWLSVAGRETAPVELSVLPGRRLEWEASVGLPLRAADGARLRRLTDARTGRSAVGDLRRRFACAWCGVVAAAVLVGLVGPTAWTPTSVAVVLQLLVAAFLVDRILAGPTAPDRCESHAERDT